MPRDTAFFITHMPLDGPAFAAVVAAEMGYAIEVVDAYTGAPLPFHAGRRDVVVVMGGSMGVADLGNPAFPWLQPVVDLLRARLQMNAPVLGICLGCQLLAHAAGGRVFPMRDGAGNRVWEVGWDTLRMNADACREIPGLPQQVDTLQWHGDACSLPPGARLLSSSPVCEVQMFRLGASVGIQFHPEVDAPMTLEWAREDAQFVRTALGPAGVERVIRQTRETGVRSDASRRQLFEAVFAGFRRGGGMGFDHNPRPPCL